jgi:hypothetical protein
MLDYISSASLVVKLELAELNTKGIKCMTEKWYLLEVKDLSE